MKNKEILDNLRVFVEAEHEANFAKLYEVWEKPLRTKIESGETQIINAIKFEDNKHFSVSLGKNESRFREGDMICFHDGDAQKGAFIRQAMIEAEYDGEWLVRADFKINELKDKTGRCYADADGMDLKPFFDKALDDVASLANGRNLILPLLSGELDASVIFHANYDDAANIAEEENMNEQQIHAVGLGVAAKHLACIQGPPGTGKTKVISLIAKLLVKEGQSVLLTSHTHTAINNALNKIAKENVPTVKVGSSSSRKGLDSDIKQFEQGSDWEDRPDNGYVIGATPFATCSSRLESFDFDTVIFDEASQVTVPLAVMAMRKAKRFVFVGDHKQLPPVVLSKSVLDEESYSVFSKLVLGNEDVSVMLNQTYRMNERLSQWPSKQYYGGNLKSADGIAKRLFKLEKTLSKYKDVLSDENAFVFIPSPGVNTRTHSKEEADLVVGLIQTAVDAGLNLSDIGVVTPYRNQAKMIKNQLSEKFGTFTAKEVVTDTVERMQGQERKMIIISLCSTDRQFIHAVANFFFQPERLNVAITRPMVKLVLIGPRLSSDFKVDTRLKSLQSNIDAYRSLISTAYLWEGV
jgi:DNA replication ATP-dependent helicase Dna2